MVMYAPGGLASLIMMNLRVAAFGKLRGSGRPTWRWAALRSGWCCWGPAR
jgi:hypothetical protein